MAKKKILFTELATGDVTHEARLVEDSGPWVGRFGILFAGHAWRLEKMRPTVLDYKIFHQLLERVEKNTGLVEFSATRLAVELGYDRASVQRSRKKFIDAGILIPGERRGQLFFDARIFWRGKIDEIPDARLHQNHLRLVVDNTDRV